MIVSITIPKFHLSAVAGSYPKEYKSRSIVFKAEAIPIENTDLYKNNAETVTLVNPYLDDVDLYKVDAETLGLIQSVGRNLFLKFYNDVTVDGEQTVYASDPGRQLSRLKSRHREQAPFFQVIVLPKYGLISVKGSDVVITPV